MFVMSMACMPKGSDFKIQSLWGAIGWATPAAFGVALAAPKRRTVLITGESSHQLTAQEIGQFARYGRKPIVFVLNNDGYLIERVLGEDPECYYNDLWRARAAIALAESSDKGAYIEIVTGKYSAHPITKGLRGRKPTNLKIQWAP